MADDVRLNQNTTTGDLIAADDIGGTKHQRVKVQIGADGLASDVHGGNPMPVGGAVTANAGSNLNTSALALENGGNLAAIAGAVAGGEMQVDVISAPALSPAVDAVTATLATDVLQDGLTPVTPKFANIATATNGDTTLVPGVASKKIRVVALSLIAAGDVNAYFKDDAASPNNLMGADTHSIDLTANMGFVLPFSPVGWFETAQSEGLVLDLDAAVRVAGCLTYVEV